MACTARSATRALAFLAAGALSAAHPLAAQRAGTETVLTLPSVPRFAVARSPIGLVADVRPREYLGVTGPRSAWLGTETGVGEMWVHPLKVAREVQLSFKIPQYRAPLRGPDVARRVEVRPEGTTITYSHMAFTVKQHIVAPRDEPGLLMLLDVESFVPLEVWVSFRPELQYMWPGAFGGQYTFFDPAHHAFVLSESLQQRNAVIGTSWPAAGEVLPTHFQADWPPTLVIQVDSARAARELVPVVMAAGTMPRDSVFAAYARILGNAQGLYEESRAWADSALAATVSVDTPDDSLDLAVEWAKVNLEEQRVCNPDLGCGFVAGWGTSGNSTRSGFGWFFGGDAAITSMAMDATGQWDRVAEALRFLARYQRADGKIPHEVSQSALRTSWFQDFPYPYYHADTTPHWMVALWSYWKASGDEATLGALWPAYQKAWAWCLTAETDGDGIIENTVGGYGAIEVGGMGDALHEDIYLAGVWINSLAATADLARHLGDGALAERADSLRAVALETLNERYWRPGEDQHAFGILQGGGTNVNLSAWPGTALSYGLLEPARAERTLRKLATDSISADWGARLLSVGSPLYDPLHYNNGAVWPFMTGYVAWGQYRYRRPWAAYNLVDAVKHHAFDWGRGRFPENFSGSYYRPMDETVPHQFFATSMLLMPLFNGTLGWEPDAPRGWASLAPQLPPDWDRVRVSRLRVGATTLDVEIVQEAGLVRVDVTSRGPAVELDVVLPVPLGASDVRVRTSGPGAGAEGPGVVQGRHDLAVTRTLRVAEGTPAFAEAVWAGGLAVAAPLVELVPGQPSSGVRVVDFTAADGGWLLELEGEAGRDYDVRLFGATPAVATVTGASAELRGGAGVGDDPHVLRVRFPAGAGRRLAAVGLSPGGE
ncbi:MAG: GH116 family glycosyl hydrolase [Longimicrobiales bacterium]|nr:GH116 family glycosyl hydrolase [Longimicrobiales bacterium]